MILKNYILTIRNLFLISGLILLSSFGIREANYCKTARQIVSKYVKEFAIPRRLMLSGRGGAMMDDIQEIFLDFLSFDKLNVEEARVLYVEMMEEFLCRINAHEKIRPYLHNYPFEESNVKLRIGFDDSERKILADGHVAQMSIAKNHILYFAAFDPDKDDFYSLHREPYEEARKIVENQK